MFELIKQKQYCRPANMYNLQYIIQTNLKDTCTPMLAIQINHNKLDKNIKFQSTNYHIASKINQNINMVTYTDTSCVATKQLTNIQIITIILSQ